MEGGFRGDLFTLGAGELLLDGQALDQIKAQAGHPYLAYHPKDPYYRDARATKLTRTG